MLQKLQNRKMAALISSRCIEGDALTKMRIQFGTILALGIGRHAAELKKLGRALGIETVVVTEKKGKLVSDLF